MLMMRDFFSGRTKSRSGKLPESTLRHGDATAAGFEWDAGFAGRGRRLAVERPCEPGRVGLERLDRAANEQIRVAKPAVGQAAPEQLGGVAGGRLRCVGHGRFIRAALGQGDSVISFKPLGQARFLPRARSLGMMPAHESH